MTCPEGGGEAAGVGEVAEGLLLGDALREGVALGFALVDGLSDALLDGSARRVEDASGFDSCVAPAAVMGRARGGSYAVPVITVWTPHHDSVTAAPVASDHASTCTSPLRIAAILHHEPHGCLMALPGAELSTAGGP